MPEEVDELIAEMQKSENDGRRTLTTRSTMDERPFALGHMVGEWNTASALAGITGACKSPAIGPSILFNVVRLQVVAVFTSAGILYTIVGSLYRQRTKLPPSCWPSGKWTMSTSSLRFSSKR